MSCHWMNWVELQKILRMADDRVIARAQTLPTQENCQGYMAELQRELVQTFGAVGYRHDVSLQEFVLHVRLSTGGMVFVSMTPSPYSHLQRDLALADPHAKCNNVEVRVGRTLYEGGKYGDVLKKRGKPKGKSATQILKELTSAVAPVHVPVVLVDGMSPVECYNRYVLMQRHEAMVNSLTPAQLDMAKRVWASYLSSKVSATEQARREADRLQVVVDFEED